MALMCRVLAVSVSGYYAWCRRAPSQREQTNLVLVEQIRQVLRLDNAVAVVDLRAGTVMRTIPLPENSGATGGRRPQRIKGMHGGT